MGELAYKRDHGVLPIASSPLPQEMRIVMHWVLSSMGMSDSSVETPTVRREVKIRAVPVNTSSTKFARKNIKVAE